MDLSLIVGCGAALAGVILALAFLPRKTALEEPALVLAESGL
jgi:hypothetical protein